MLRLDSGRSWNLPTYHLYPFEKSSETPVLPSERTVSLVRRTGELFLIALQSASKRSDRMRHLLLRSA